MAVAVVGKNPLTLSNCESSSDNGTWLFTTQDADNVKQGTYSLCGICKSIGNNDVTFTPTTSKDLLNKHVRFWGMYTQGKLMDIYTNGGIQFWVTAGGVTGYWYVGGRDTYTGGWQNFVVDLSKAVDAGTKPSDVQMQSVTVMGIRLVLATGVKNAVNTWIDCLNACDGLTVSGDIDTGVITCSVDATAGTYTWSGGTFVTLGFKVGKDFTPSGYTNGGNNTNRTIATVTNTVITVTDKTGLITESGTGDERIRGYFDFEDVFQIVDTPATGGLGVLTKKSGIYCLTGMMEFGSTTTLTKFQAKSQVVVFENRPNKDGTLSNINSNLMNFTISDDGNSARTTEFILGEKSGTQGISGCLVRVQNTDQIAKFNVTATSANISDFKLYGSIFLDANSIQFPLTGANIEVLNCSFESCGEVIPQTCIVKYCNFISANNRGCRISTASHQVSDSNFIKCLHGIHVNISGGVTITNLLFSGADGVIYYDVEHSAASALTLTRGGTSNPVYVEETGGGSTSLPGSVPITIHVENESGTAIVGAQAYVQKSTPTLYTAAAGNTAGNTALIVNETVDTDTPQTGWCIVWDKSANEIMPYRYASWVTKTFTFKTEVTGTTTSLGTITTLYNTGGGFGGATDIQEGDTIRNTTDGSWAVVDEIVSSTELLTSELQGGSTNIWGNGHNYSVHKLAITLINGDDTIDIPIVNMQTDSSGNISKTYTGNPTSVKIRIRSNQGATKYLPYDTSGSIVSGTGYSLMAVMLRDEVAT